MDRRGTVHWPPEWAGRTFGTLRRCRFVERVVHWGSIATARVARS